MMDEARLREIEARAQAATAGELHSGPVGPYEAISREIDGEWEDLLCSENRAADAILFANARTDILDLLAENARLRAILRDVDVILDGMAMEGVHDWLKPGVRPLYAETHLRVQEAVKGDE